MVQKKKRKRLSLAPMGTPGRGLGTHRNASASGSGRLGRALKQVRKSATTAPRKPEKPKARALAERENEDGKVEATSLRVKRSKASAKKGTSKARGKSKPPKHSSSDVTSGPAASTKSPIGSRQQKRARTAAKNAKIKEAGIDSRRLGQVSARVKRAQARRDSK